MKSALIKKYGISFPFEYEDIRQGYLFDGQAFLVKSNGRMIVMSDFFKQQAKKYKLTSYWSTALSPDLVITKGSYVIFDHFGGSNDQEMIRAKSVQIYLDEDTPLGQCIKLLEDKGMQYIESQGGTHMRQYYIEGIRPDNKANIIEIMTGT